jgi:hypothetical protein
MTGNDPSSDPNFTGVKQPAFDSLVSSHARAVGLLDQLASDLWTQLRVVGVDTSPALRIRTLANQLRGQVTDLRRRQAQVHAMQRRRKGAHWDTPSGTYWTLPPDLPPAPPPMCSIATPEYCHASGENTKREEELLLQWLRASRGSAPPGQPYAVTTEYYRDGDPFTEDVKRLVTLDAVRGQIERDIAAGRMSGNANFHYADMTAEQRKIAALNNALALMGFAATQVRRRAWSQLFGDPPEQATRSGLGMQYALAFLGSYDLEWKVVGVDANGNPVVEFWLHNASTKSSASPDPDKVRKYLPGESADSPDAAGPGEHYTRQSIRWREPFVDGGAQVGSGFRRSAGPLPDLGSRWNQPTEKDPLVPDSVYDSMEWILKRAL